VLSGIERIVSGEGMIGAPLRILGISRASAGSVDGCAQSVPGGTEATRTSAAVSVAAASFCARRPPML
jgi:hypothetical protein